MSIGQLSAFALLVSCVRSGAVNLFEAYQETWRKCPKLMASFRLMDRPSQIPVNTGLVLRPGSMRGEVRLVNVHFSYPASKRMPVFRGLNLTLPVGKSTAICGVSGGGKSSLVSLIMRDYDPSQGAVLIDGHDLRTLNLTSLHKQMAVVSQEPVLFSGTIADNIRFGIEHGYSGTSGYGTVGGKDTMEHIKAAARTANAHDFICAFPKGYDTEVGERGLQLSGGQKQRIAIARAILMDPRILILDEATSALDSESEFAVQEALERVMVGRTTMIVAHRLSTIKNADNILIMQDGSVAEEGTHSELIAKGGVYASLVARQLASSA